MKIKVIFTGGTIGSRLENGYIGLGGAPYALIEEWKKTHTHSEADFEACEPYSVLSENITADHLAALADCLSQQLDGADAVIVTHGTDTLCYTAAFLGLLFADVKIPVVLVSSGYPLEDSRANGHENFAAAADFVKSGIGGVFAVWYANDEARVHLGTRTLPHTPYSDMLCSVDDRYFGTVKNGEFVPNPRGEIGGMRRFPKETCGKLSGFGRVLTLACRPGMCYPRLDGNIGAVLFESYHSGTMCADSRLEAFVSNAKALGIPLFLSGAGGRDTDYESVKLYREMEILPLKQVSPSAAYVKLSLALSCGCELKSAMNESFGGEYIDER